MSKDRLRYFLLLAILPWALSISVFSQEKVSLEAYAEIQKSGYMGEVYEYSIILKSNTPNIADIRIAASPQFDSSLEILRGTVNNRGAHEIQEKGKTSYCWTIQRNFIIPKEAGKYTVGDWKFVAFIPRERVVKDYFWGARRIVEYEEVPVDCKSVNFKVDKLPENKTGEEFSGCVGEFVIEGWFPPGNIHVGKEAVAVYTISGYGSLDNLRIPNVSKLFNNNCRLREIDQNESQTQRGGKLFSEVTLTCTFIPDSPEFSIDPLSLLFFNPETKKYEVKQSNPLYWDVKEEQGKKTTSPKDVIEI